MDKDDLIRIAKERLQALKSLPQTRWIENDIRAWKHILKHLKDTKKGKRN